MSIYPISTTTCELGVSAADTVSTLLTELTSLAVVVQSAGSDSGDISFAVVRVPSGAIRHALFVMTLGKCNHNGETQRTEGKE